MTSEGNLLVGQSGGPTPVINSSLAGVISEAQKILMGVNAKASLKSANILAANLMGFGVDIERRGLDLMAVGLEGIVDQITGTLGDKLSPNIETATENFKSLSGADFRKTLESFVTGKDISDKDKDKENQGIPGLIKSINSLVTKMDAFMGTDKASAPRSSSSTAGVPGSKGS